MEKIRAIIKLPLQVPHVEWVENKLKTFQGIVGGYIETVLVNGGIVIICNEEGRLRGLEDNCSIVGVDFVGPICVVGRKGDEFANCPLSLPDFRKIIEWEAVKIPTKWTRIGVSGDENGRTITYSLEGTKYTIESRLRHVPHANGVGTWDHTFYHVLDAGEEIAMKSTLVEAKKVVEGRLRG